MTDSHSPQSPSSSHIEVRTKNKISVIMPTYNQANFIGESIESVLAQSYPDWELVIINDGSTDNTLEVVSKYQREDKRIKVFSKENGGTGSALNLGIRNATNQRICWLSSDDLYEQNALEIMDKAIHAYPEFKFFHGNFSHLYSDTGMIEKAEINTKLIEDENLSQTLTLLKTNIVNGISICISREELLKEGLFNPSNRYGQDYEMWLRLSRRLKFKYLPEYLSITRFHSKMGAVAFPHFGRIDSSLAASRFLNEFGIDDFYMPDYSNPSVEGTIILQVAQLIMNPHAIMYEATGMDVHLFRRLAEHITKPERAHSREILKHPSVAVIWQAFQATPILAAEGAQLYRMVYEYNGTAWKYEPKDPDAALLNRYRLTISDPTCAEENEKLSTYMQTRADLRPYLARGEARKLDDR